MGRTAPTTTKQTPPAPDAPPPIQGPATAAPPLPGGTEGVPDQGTVSPIGQNAPGGSAVREKVEVKVRQFRVLNGGHVMENGMRHHVKVGKIIDENQADLDLWRKQGIRFEQLNPEPPPEAVENAEGLTAAH